MFRLAYILLLLILTYQFIVQATNSPNVFPREESALDCVEGPPKRTLFNIVWSCLSTTIICAWTALHPNIPPCEGTFKGVLRRLELMFWTMVAPEILPCCALNQTLAAMAIRDVYNEAKGHKEDGTWEWMKAFFSLHEITNAGNAAWTLKHGHFLIMGGIHLVEPAAKPEGNSTSSETPTGMEQSGLNDVNVEPRDASDKGDTEKGQDPSGIKPKPRNGRVTILTLEMLRVLLQDPEFEIEITEAEITRTSKGDGLSKAIFIFQSSWFILQCIARHVQGLSLTQLELTTLALASLNGITFILWWHKPLGAQTIVRVYLKRELTNEERNVEGRGNSRRSKFCRHIRNLFKYCRNKHWMFFPLAILLFPIVALGMAFVYTIMDVVRSTSFPVDATHVPTFYVPNHESTGIHLLILLALGIIFGGIHCAGWNFPFPTYQEQKLWRIASLGVTVLPFCAATILNSLVAELIKSIHVLTHEVFFSFIWDPIFKILLAIVQFGSDVADRPNKFLSAFFMAAYVCARLILLGQALALLRNLPPSAFITIDWSQFYPHFL